MTPGEQWPPHGGYPRPGQPRPPRHARATGPQPAAPAHLNGYVNGQLNGHYPAGPPPVNGQDGRWYPRPPGEPPFPRYPAPPWAGAYDYAPHDYPPPPVRPIPPPVNGHGTPAYPPANSTLLAGPARDWAGPDNGGMLGKRVLGWLPFGHRLVLLPKAPAFPDQDRELREHRDVAGGWLRPAVFGAMDGLVTNSSLIAGIGGGGGGGGMIVLTGIAGLIAGAFSMATGEYISVTSQNELTAAEVELERLQHMRDPAGKLNRLTEVFIGKGVSPNLAEAVVRQISADPDRAVATHVREELGIDPDDLPSPRTAAAASFAAFTVGALIPLSPFLLGYPVLKLALAVAGAAAIAGGAAVAKLTGRSMVAGGLRQFTAAFLATGMAFAVGHLISGHIS